MSRDTREVTKASVGGTTQRLSWNSAHEGNGQKLRLVGRSGLRY